MSEQPVVAVDAGVMIRSKEYRRLLVIAAVIGLGVSLASWCFLELVYWIQQGVYVDLPTGLGFSDAPWWWPLPVLLVAGLLTAFAVLRLPGAGGHIPYGASRRGRHDRSTCRASCWRVWLVWDWD